MKQIWKAHVITKKKSGKIWWTVDINDSRSKVATLLFSYFEDILKNSQWITGSGGKEKKKKRKGEMNKPYQ